MMNRTGGNNPPVPSAPSDSTTGSVFTSTDTDHLKVPEIAGKPAATIEGPRHANVSTDDTLTYLKKQHVALQRFVWSTSQLPGTLLVNIPITPLRANLFVSYLAGMYNAWNGGLEYLVKVAGTGFHAGALGVARIPPNIDPTTFKTVAQFTAFEYVVIDPKTLEAVSKHIPDQRPVMYHYVSNNFTDPNVIGGHFVIFVLLQLNTSSTGTNQIDVQILNRLAPDFRFIQIVPPNLTTQPPTDVEKWGRLFSTPSAHLSTVVPAGVDDLTILAPGAVSAAKLGLTTLSGQPNGDPTYLGEYVDTATGIGTPVIGYTFRATSATTIVPTIGAGPSDRNVVFPSGSFISAFPAPPVVITPTGSISLKASTAVTGAVTDTYYFLRSLATPTYPGVSAVAPPAGESLVTFDCRGGTLGAGLTTTFLSAAFRSREYVIATNEAVLCILNSRSTGAPLTYIKIYHSGVITAPAMEQTSFSLFDLQCTFVSYVQGTTPFPNLNLTMLQSLQTQRLEQLIQEARRMRVL